MTDVFAKRQTKSPSQTTREESSVQRGFHVPPLRLSYSKSKQKTGSKKKNKLSNGLNQSGDSEEDQSESSQQDSLRWVGALEDPIAEAQRLEKYKANRRKRYMASRQAFIEKSQNCSGTDPKPLRLKTQKSFSI